MKKAPTGGTTSKMGDQQGHSLYIPAAYNGHTQSATPRISETLSPVNREEANIEAERNETILGDFDGDGQPEHFTVGGQRHYNGGTPLQVPDGSFVFSDDRRLKMSGPVLQQFGKANTTKKKFTPAALAKQYPLNTYKAQLEDPGSDHLDQSTAQLMINNHQQHLSKLALLQEAMKGFPEGVPPIAMPAIPTGALPGYRTGGPVSPVDPHKGDKNDPRKYQRDQLRLKKGFNQYSTPWLEQYGYTNNPQGLDEAIRTAGYQGDLNDAKAVQQFLIAENLRRGNQGLFQQLQQEYGMTNQGIRKGFSEETTDTPTNQQDLEKIYADGKFGVRSGWMLRSLMDKPLQPSTVAMPKIPYSLRKPDVAGLVPNIPAPAAQPPAIDWKKRGEDPMPWWTQDVINTGAAFGNRYNIKKYTPSYIGMNAITPVPTFMDPARPLAAIQEQGAQQQYVNALLAGPAQSRAANAQAQGQVAAQAAGILSQVQNNNVGIANEFEGKKTDILNNLALKNNLSRKQYHDEWATVNQQYDNSVMQANDSVRNNLINGMTNAQRTSWMNQFPQFRVDPRTGRIAFTKGRDLRSGMGSAPMSGGSTIDAYDQLYQQAKAKGYTDDKAHEWASKNTFGNRSKFTADSDGDAQMSTSGSGMNPLAMQLLSTYAPQFLPR